MIPHSMIIDEFLPDFDDFRAWADEQVYAPVINPADCVEYPGICKEVPVFGTRLRLQAIMQQPVHIRAAFMRLSLEGSRAPHQAHNDALMGHYSMMLYLNRPEHCRGGTSLVRHLSGDDMAHWELDHSDPSKWRVYSIAEMQPNRAFIFRAELFHRAEPVGGFGTDPTNGRLVYTAFFDVQ